MRVLIVLPVKNESEILAEALDFAMADMSKLKQLDWHLLVVDNGSTDNSRTILNRYCEVNPNVSYISTTKGGKGNAIKLGWSSEKADAYCFSDIDQGILLSTAVIGIKKAMESGYDGVTFVRKIDTSGRPFVRQLFSYLYRVLSKIIIRTSLKDLPCGMKAINESIKKSILPDTEDASWFFDSELILRAEYAGYKLKQIPVLWTDKRFTSRNKKVPIFKISFLYLKSLVRLKKSLLKS